MKSRFLGLAAVFALAACGGGEGEKKVAERADTLQPGQYEVTSEVTQFTAADEGTPKLDMPVGTRTTRSVCIADGAQLPPDLFADEGFECRNAGNAFVRGGTLNVNLNCDREGLAGSTSYTVTGTFQSDSFEAERQLTTRLTTDGDVRVASNVTGRRTGECVAAPAGNVQADAAAKESGQ